MPLVRSPSQSLATWVFSTPKPAQEKIMTKTWMSLHLKPSHQIHPLDFTIFHQIDSVEVSPHSKEKDSHRKSVDIKRQGRLRTTCFCEKYVACLLVSNGHMVHTQYATGDQWRTNSRKYKKMEPKQKQHPLVDVTGDGSKV